MTDLTQLYHEVIIDHGKNPRNYGVLDNEKTRSLQGVNPLCGDQLTLYLDVEGGKIVEAKFVGHGCAISMASGSLMTQAVKGKTLEEAKALFEAFHGLLLKEKIPEEVAKILGKLIILEGVAAYPSRIKCATLAWHTLNGILEGGREPVSTEEDAP